MGYQDCLDALNLKMPKKIPRTEYSAQTYWDLVNAVTGLSVGNTSSDEEKRLATIAFTDAWDFGMKWNVMHHSDAFKAKRTSMGHAVFQQGGTDYNDDVSCPFEDEEEVLNFDPFETFGEVNEAEIIKKYNDHFALAKTLAPNQVNMTGSYVTLVSALISIFGWDMLLVALGTDPERFGEMTNRIAEWNMQYYRAMAKSDSPIIMLHDDIVWTEGAFVSPDWYRKYVFPNYERYLEPLFKAGKKVLYTSDGNYTEFIDDIAKCGFEGFVMEPTTDMEYIAKHYGQTHSFVGNADCRVLTFGTKEEIKKEVERCVNIGKECPGFIMAVGNHISPSVPVENAIYYNDCFQELANR